MAGPQPDGPHAAARPATAARGVRAARGADAAHLPQGLAGVPVRARRASGRSPAATPRRSPGPGGWSTWRTSTCGPPTSPTTWPPRCGSTETLQLVVVVPRVPDQQGALSERPQQHGQSQAMQLLQDAAPDRVHVFDLENHAGTPVYVHAKVCVVDDVWAEVGSDNMNRRSWTHDSELSNAVLDPTQDPREPCDPAGPGRRRPHLRPRPAPGAGPGAPGPRRRRGPAGPRRVRRGVRGLGARRWRPGTPVAGWDRARRAGSGRTAVPS